VDVYPLDCANLRHRCPHQTPQVGRSPVAAVCDRRRSQGRDAAPSGSQASGAESAVPGLEGGFAASHGRRRRAIPTQEFSMGADAPWCGSTSRSTQGRVGSPQRTQTSGAESAVLSAFSSLTRHSRAAASYHE
jgi:hypothetical protein